MADLEAFAERMTERVDDLARLIHMRAPLGGDLIETTVSNGTAALAEFIKAEQPDWPAEAVQAFAVKMTGHSLALVVSHLKRELDEA